MYKMAIVYDRYSRVDWTWNKGLFLSYSCVLNHMRGIPPSLRSTNGGCWGIWGKGRGKGMGKKAACPLDIMSPASSDEEEAC